MENKIESNEIVQHFVEILRASAKKQQETDSEFESFLNKMRETFRTILAPTITTLAEQDQPE